MGKHFLKYPRKNISTARMLRKNMTDAERKLWSLLRNNQLGVKFRRQVPIGPYIVDFLAIKANLVIELDGSQHYTDEAKGNDLKRDNFQRRQGLTVLRYSDTEFLQNIDGVMQQIYEQVQRSLSKENPLC